MGDVSVHDGPVVADFVRSDGRRRALAVLGGLLAAWGGLYAAYRAYYAAGGRLGMIGTPASDSLWRGINLAAVAALLLAAAAPVALVPLWRHRPARLVLICVSWLAAVACVGHALIDDVQRIASLTGAFTVRYPSLWANIDRRSADVQDLVWNESWFLLEGLLWGALAWVALGRGRSRRVWAVTAAAATAVATLVGLLSAFGVIGRVVVG